MNRFYFLVIALLLISSSVFAQEFRVKGSVISSEDNLPVIGATVLIKGTKIGTSTDINGAFEITIPKIGTVLSVSFIGMSTQDVIVENTNPVKVVLSPDATIIDAVVVTALGIKRSEKALGYSVQNVSSDKLIAIKGVDVGSSLTGKVAGLLVKNSTDFATAPNLSIRGENPLLVIDGVPYGNMTLRDVSADDIESVSILKGATASALYGYRGANGAVMVTTKQGSKEQGIQISINSNTMFDAGFLAIPEKQGVYGRGQTSGVYSYNQDQAWGRIIDGSDQYQWDPVTKEYRTYAYLPVGKDNFKNFLEQSYITNNNVSLSYQGKYSSVRSSVTWVKTKGQYPNNTLDKYNYQIGGDINLDKFKFSSNVAYYKQSSPNIGFNGYTNYDPMYSLLIWTAPDYNILDYKDYWTIKNEKQNFTYQNNTRQGGNLTTSHNNPYFSQYEKLNIINRDIFNATASASYEFTPWLKASLRSGLDFYADRQDVKISKDSYVSSGNTGPNGGWYGSLDGAYATGRNSGYSINNDLIISGEKTWDKLTVDGLVGGTIFFRQDDAMAANTVNGISIPAFFSLKASVDKPNVTSTLSKQQVNSLYGRLAFSWDRMVYVEGTLRNDWSSTLPSDTRSYLYPSVSGSFIVSELLPKKFDWLSMWKLRGSWTMSKTPPDVYATNSVYSVTNSAWGSLASAYLPNSLVATDVLPQAATTFEVGTQVILWNNRLMVDVSYYDKLMYDFLKSAAISPSTGYVTSYLNIDEEISRRGWEVSVSGTPVLTTDWRVDIGANWSTYARYYNKLDPKYSTDKPWVKEGERVDAYVLNDYLRDPSGNIIYSNGVVQYASYTSNFGWFDPDWVWGVNSTVSYKNFSLSLSFDGRVGGLTNSMTESYLWNSGNHPESLTATRALDVATPGSKNFVGQGVKVVSGTVAYDVYGNITSDTRTFAPNDIAITYKDYVNRIHAGIAWGGSGRPADIYSTTFIKLRELSLTYNLPKSAYSTFGAKGASVSFVGQNLFFWAKDFKYSDPDGGSDNFNDPSLRYLGFNIKLNF